MKFCLWFFHNWTEWETEIVKAPVPPPDTKGHLLYMARQDTETKRRRCLTCGKKQEKWIK